MKYMHAIVDGGHPLSKACIQGQRGRPCPKDQYLSSETQAHFNYEHTCIHRAESAWIRHSGGFKIHAHAGA